MPCAWGWNFYRTFCCILIHICAGNSSRVDAELWATVFFMYFFLEYGACPAKLNYKSTLFTLLRSFLFSKWFFFEWHFLWLHIKNSHHLFKLSQLLRTCKLINFLNLSQMLSWYLSLSLLICIPNWLSKYALFLMPSVGFTGHRPTWHACCHEGEQWLRKPDTDVMVVMRYVRTYVHNYWIDCSCMLESWRR